MDEHDVEEQDLYAAAHAHEEADSENEQLDEETTLAASKGLSALLIPNVNNPGSVKY